MFDHDRNPAAGTAVVWHGERPEPVLVLDPAGKAKHDELPGTWRARWPSTMRIGW